VGTKAADSISALGGNDRVFALNGADVVTAGEGNDLVVGGRGDDTLSGDAGNDLLFANAGVDVLNGGDGNDRLWAVARADVVAGADGAADTVGDTLNGGAGNDRLYARDGEADTISCGDGTDVANLDNADVISDATAEAPNGSCEKVNRAEPKTRDANAVKENLQQRVADIVAKLRGKR
ncbi:MAG: hypothetical protein NWS55_05975, partial [Solirubrobacteraceae bacterium]|nr:hypothetical protein [Solirubrobacteraceae bacterium]MDP4673151.1 hypothetical protein [Solirubrobacteraceae bacterium]